MNNTNSMVTVETVVTIEITAIDGRDSGDSYQQLSS